MATLVDLVKIVATSTGDGPISLGQAVSGFRGTEALIDGAQYSYSIQQGTTYEFGRCTYLASGTQIVRSPLNSSLGGAPIPLAQNAQVSFVALAEDLDSISLSNAAIAAASAAATSEANAAASAAAAAASAVGIGNQLTLAEASATSASISQQAAQGAAASVGFLNAVVTTGGASPYTVTGITLGTAGSGATVSGEFDLIVSGGPTGHAAKVTVTGGAITSARIVRGGPTYTLPTISGLTGATAPTATVGQLQNGQTFEALSSDNQRALLWQVSSSVLAPVNDGSGAQVSRYFKAGVDASIAALGILKKIGGSEISGVYADKTRWLRITPTQFLHPVIDALNTAVASLQSSISSFIGAAQRLSSKVGTNEVSFYFTSDKTRWLRITPTKFQHPVIDSLSTQVTNLVNNGAGASYMVRDPKWDSIQIIGEVAHFEGYGQSLAQGYPGALYDTGSLASALMFSGGVRPDDLSVDPAVIYTSLVALQERYLTGGMADPSANDSGSVGETPMYGAMQMLAQLMVSDAGTDPTTNGQKFMASVSARGGAPAAQLTKASGVRYPRLLANIQNGPLAAAAIGKSYASAGLFYTQGEADSSAKTAPATWTSTVLGIQASVQSDWQAAAGNARPVPMFVNQSSSVAGYYAGAQPDIPIAQLQMALSNDYVCHVGPSWFMPYRNSDIHMVPQGYKWLGAYYGWAAYQWLYKGYKPVPLRPVIRAEGSRIIARYPVLAGRKLVIDTSYLELMPNFGMRAFNAAGAEKTLSNPRVVGRDCIVWDASETPADQWYFGYAWSAQTATNKTTLFGGNVRDDNPLIFDPNGLNVPMYRWAPTDKITLTA